MQNLKKKLNFPYIIQRTLYNSEKKATNDFLAFTNRSKLTLSKKYTKRKTLQHEKYSQEQDDLSTIETTCPPLSLCKIPKREGEPGEPLKEEKEKERGWDS